MAVATSTGFAAPPEITHTTFPCVSPKSNAKITANVSGSPSSVRVYFHGAGQTCGDYYVDMLPDPANPSVYSAVLPLAANDAGAIVYDVRAKSVGGKEISTPRFSAPVKDTCPATPLTPTDLQRAKSIVLGLTQKAQSAVPCKFACNGITSIITDAGDLKPNEECRLFLAKAGKGFLSTPAGEAVAGATALFGAAAGYEIEKNQNHRPPSPARP